MVTTPDVFLLLFLTPSKDYLIPEPFGCALQISPWNFPFQLSLATLIGAVAAGNTVVLKPSEHAPKTAALLADVIAEAFSTNTLLYLTGDAKVAQELLAFIDHIIFTGSTHIGKIVAKAAANHPTILELGGKPLYCRCIGPHRIECKTHCLGKYVNCGQTCIAPDYLLVDRKN